MQIANGHYAVSAVVYGNSRPETNGGGAGRERLKCTLNCYRKKGNEASDRNNKLPKFKFDRRWQ